MKPDTTQGISINTDPFPGLLGRGLIEARPARPAGERALHPSPVYWAGASLKRARGVVPGHGRQAFPGLLGRGLIEAVMYHASPNNTAKPSPVYWAGASLKPCLILVPSSLFPTFPGLLGRGLIEASAGWRCRRRPAATLPSPVYWAGASLKRMLLLISKRTVEILPRSTGPGPH